MDKVSTLRKEQVILNLQMADSCLLVAELPEGKGEADIGTVESYKATVFITFKDGTDCCFPNTIYSDEYPNCVGYESRTKEYGEDYADEEFAQSEAVHKSV